jgi:hypothetical protein
MMYNRDYSVGLHQEKLCQLTGHLPSQKYERSSTGRGVAMTMMLTLSAIWRALADDTGPSGASTLKRVEELAQLVSAACEEVAQQIAVSDPSRVLERLTHILQKRRRRILERSRGRSVQNRYSDTFLREAGRIRFALAVQIPTRCCFGTEGSVNVTLCTRQSA